MRSPREIKFRLRQEAVNAVLSLTRPPAHLTAQTPLPPLPKPLAIAGAVQGTNYAENLLRLADHLVTRPFSVLGIDVDFSRPIEWRRDPLSGTESAALYFRRIPYLDTSAVGDHKAIWEINRHQHLVLLAQAFVLSHRPEFFDAIVRHLEHWWQENPFQRGINWASALEVAFRALSWVWIWHLVGDRMAPAFRQRFLAELYRHGLYLEYNLSIYFSPNTHLLGEAVALHAMGKLFPEFPRARRWRRIGGRLVSEHMATKVNQDGSYHELSTYYHVYALDMFLFHAVLEETSTAFRDGLNRMAEFLAAVANGSGTIPFLGDDDGGRFFFPFGDPRQHARATLAVASSLLNRRFSEIKADDFLEIAAWWLGPHTAAQSNPSAVQSSRAFRDAGIVVLRRGNAVVLFDAGPFGPGSGGHSHSDTLSIVMSDGVREVLVDPGTYNYMDPKWRSAFRGSAAHNTVRIEGLDQGTEAGPFRWTKKPDVSLLEFSTVSDVDRAVGICHYGGFSHRRTVELRCGSELSVVDELDGPGGEHMVEQFWHFASEPRQSSSGAWQLPGMAELTLPDAVLEQGWRSTSFGTRQPSPVLVVRKRLRLPCTLSGVVKLVR